jgi:DNA-binding NarL/FixJ family response regulator
MEDQPMSKCYRLIITDDHLPLRKGLISILENSPDFLVMGEANDGFELLNLLHQGMIPDVLILDLSMPMLSGIDVLHRIKHMNYASRILVLTLHKELDYLCQSFLLGACGYMLKDGMARELLPALHTLIEDRIYISPAMARELPDECQAKQMAERRLPPSSIMHCSRNVPEHQDSLNLSL